MKLLRASKRGLAITGAGIAALAVAVVAVLAYDSWALNQWASEDATHLRPYPEILLQEGAPDRLPLRPLDRPLVAHLAKDRLVVQLSRSDYRHNLLRTEAWVKVHLVTRNPAATESTVPIKLLVRLEQEDQRWSVDSVREIALP